jgi:hypothetical protein
MHVPCAESVEKRVLSVVLRLRSKQSDQRALSKVQSLNIIEDKKV